MAEDGPVFGQIYVWVRRVPPGRVVTYGQIAGLVGGISAQMVGFALAALRNTPEHSQVPWQRVINAQGRVSPHGWGIGSERQRFLLEDEGVEFNAEGVIDLQKYRWSFPDLAK